MGVFKVPHVISFRYFGYAILTIVTIVIFQVDLVQFCGIPYRNNSGPKSTRTSKTRQILRPYLHRPQRTRRCDTGTGAERMHWLRHGRQVWMLRHKTSNSCIAAGLEFLPFYYERWSRFFLDCKP